MIIGGLLQYSAVYIPIVMLTSLEYCAGATFPLAFIIMGATLRMSLKFKWEVWGCAALKTLVTPALSTAVISYFSILSGDHLVAFFILVGSPAAAITIAISSVTSSDDFFAAEVVGLSIILSFVFVTLGLSIL